MIIMVTNDSSPAGTPQQLTPSVERILQYLNVQAGPPTLRLLDQLVTAYTARVPWESASRIARRATILNTADCPRWPDAFWRSAIEQGMGGTCFESNYAFFWVLKALGFSGYFTINNMGEVEGCHTALVITLDTRRFLVDVGMPIYLPIPLDEKRVTGRETAHHTFSVEPLGDGQYAVWRDRHPRPDCYTLIDSPVSDADYRAATTADYGPDGLFLNRVIVHRIVDGVVWRFAGDDAPYHLESFDNGDKTYHLLGHDAKSAAHRVAACFGMNTVPLVTAIEQTSNPSQY